MRSVSLNQAGTSWPKPEPVRAAVLEALQGDPAHWPERFETAHREVAEFFHIPDPSRLLLTPGCTSALALAVADHPWSEGDRVLTSGLEHHALHRPLVQLAGRGVQLEVLPRTSDEPVVLDALEKALRAGRVRLVALSAASNVTGERLPVAEALALARAYGSRTLIDAAQVAGWWDLDVPALGADLLAFAGHKGLQAPWGIGGLYIAPGVALHSPAATCEVPLEGNLPACSTLPGYCDVGSVDRLALAGLAAAVRWLRAPDQAGRLERAQGLADRFRQGLKAYSGVTLHGSAKARARMPTVAFTVAGRPSMEIARGLASHGVVVAGGLQCAPLAHETLGTAPDGVVRLSVGPSNMEEDLARALEALRQVVAG